jgi:hypothetical protein
MAMLLKGQIDITKILVDVFDSRNKNCDVDIARLVAASLVFPRAFVSE